MQNRLEDFGLELEEELSPEDGLPEEAPIQQTFVLIKPDGVARGLIGEVIRRLEVTGLKLKHIKIGQYPKEIFEELYAEHRNKEHFAPLIEFMASGQVVPMVWEGPHAVKRVRFIVGPTNPNEAPKWTIRGALNDGSGIIRQNIVHAADSIESAEREIKLFFS